MKNLSIFLKAGIAIMSISFLAACTSSLPIMTTAVPGEHLVIARNSGSIFSSLEEAQKEAITQAMNYCQGLGKVYSKRYVVDRPMAVGQVPESSLYFNCIDPIKVTGKDADKGMDKTVKSPESIKKTCTELGFTAGSQQFGQCVLKLME